MPFSPPARTRPCSRPLQAVPRTWLTGEGILPDAVGSHVNLHDGQNGQDTCVGYAVCEVGQGGTGRARIDGGRSIVEGGRAWLDGGGSCCGLLLCYEAGYASVAMAPVTMLSSCMSDSI